ncbi:unnamed protein product [Dicrocoelium dendriticum]|nr:unnamed protein product [Dicrocoelium dendriticum]
MSLPCNVKQHEMARGIATIDFSVFGAAAAEARDGGGIWIANNVDDPKGGAGGERRGRRADFATLRLILFPAIFDAGSSLNSDPNPRIRDGE